MNARDEILSNLLAHERDFRVFLARRVGDEAAEDILQDVFARSLDRLDTVRDPAAAVAWFYRALRNAVVDAHRRHGVVQRKLDAFAAEIEIPAADVDGEVCRCVARLAENLKPEYAEVLRRTAVEEVAVKDYAEEAGIGRSNAAVRAFRAREALRKQVEATCGSCAGAGCGNCTCGH